MIFNEIRRRKLS